MIHIAAGGGGVQAVRLDGLVSLPARISACKLETMIRAGGANRRRRDGGRTAGLRTCLRLGGVAAGDRCGMLPLPARVIALPTRAIVLQPMSLGGNRLRVVRTWIRAGELLLRAPIGHTDTIVRHTHGELPARVIVSLPARVIAGWPMILGGRLHGGGTRIRARRSWRCGRRRGRR